MNAQVQISKTRTLGDHSADWRMLWLAGAAVIVGSAGAAGAWVLLKLIAIATNLFWFGRLSAAPAQMLDNRLGLAAVFIPAIGGLIIGVMARFGSDKIRGHGIPEAIEAILYGESRLSAKVAVLKPLSSAISIGSGGPFGAEGPIIMTGGAIGSLFAQCFDLSAAERKTLLVAGAAAGMTAIFGTPLAAILLAVEVLLFEWKPRSFVPVVVAALVALAWRPTLIASGPMFPFAAVGSGGVAALAMAAALGALVGVEAALLSKLLYWIEDVSHRVPIHWMWWPAVGGLVVGIGGLIDPRVLGAGYQTIQALLDGSMLLKAVLLLLVAKAVVWLVALGSGTSGGILAPLLIIGGAVGVIAGQWLPGGPGFWAMVAMAGIVSGAMRAPMTGAIFAVELTGHFAALPETIAASVGAYAVSVLVMRRSILTEKIARRGRHILQEYTVDPLEFLQARQIMTAEPICLPGTMPASEAVAFFAQRAAHRSYPVVDGANRLIGIVSRSDALEWQVSLNARDAALSELLSDSSQPFGFVDSPVGDIADLIIKTGVGRIPIVDPATMAVVGILTRHDLLRARHDLIQSETRRGR